VRTLPIPSLESTTVYLACISRVRKRQLRRDLESIVDVIEEDALTYEQLSQSKNWYLFNESENVNGIISKEEMEKVYTNRMAKIDAPGRRYYDQIIESTPFNICPLCAHRTVEQLDHYLPKAKFPSLVVLPINLVPSCEKCNKVKLDEKPNNSEQQILHPYFDDVTGHQWLFAKVTKTSPASFVFFVRDVDAFNDELNKRIRHHFSTLKLNRLYASQAGAFVEDIKHRLNDLYNRAGMNEVRNYLRDEETTRRLINVNSWQRAMFQALSNSTWFCDGGFRV